MPQIALHPDDLPNGQAVIQGPISQREQDLGKVFDLSCLYPGDLILVSAIAPGFMQRSIRKIQTKGGYLLENAKWEHAAMYIGKGVLCEATADGVNRAMLANYIGSHIIRARRDLLLSRDSRWELAMQALSFQGYSYGYMKIIRLLWMARLGYADDTQSNISWSKLKSAVICSELYADSYGRVTRKVIGNVNGNEVTPASLSAEVTLSDVPLQWLAT